jgi:eukaryotic-like serine/threonine-protein kinase
MIETAAGNGRAGGDSLDPALEDLLRELIDDWTAGAPRPLRAYLDRRPEVAGRREAVIELINQEVAVRQLRGETPRLADYLGEFPELTESLERLFEVHALTSGGREPDDRTAILSPSEGPIVPGPVGVGMPRIPGYDIEGLLGRGGMGVVYLARHLGLNRRVALKLLQESRQEEPGLVARFRREAEAAARCQHPNLVQIHDVGEHDGRFYLALEYVAGGHLGRALAGQPQPPRKAAELVETLARAIDHAHAEGVVHRDLKPANVLLTPDGQPKITDFGLAKLRDSTTDTEVGTMLGTLAYMAPEQVQARSGEIGPRTDIHALGAILYEALTGRPPYRAETPERILHAILSEEVVPPSVRQPGVPRDLEAICLKCLEKEPSRRFDTAADLAEDLRRFLDGRPTAAHPPSPAERCLRWGRRNRGAVAAIAGLAILATLSTWQAIRATEAERRSQVEAETSRAVNEFLADILSQTNSDKQPRLDVWVNGNIKVRTALDIAAEGIGERFRGRPLVEAGIRLAIGDAYREFGAFDQARPHLERALALRSRELGERDPQTLIAKYRLGLLLVEDKPDEAEPLLVSAMEGLRDAKGLAAPEALIAMQGVGALRVKKGDHDRGRELLSRAVEGLRAASGPDHIQTFKAVYDLAMAFQAQEQPEQAKQLLKESIRRLEQPVDRKDRAALDARFRLAVVLAHLGDHPEAIRLLEELRRVQRDVLGDGHHSLLLTTAMLGRYYIIQKRYDEAEPLLLKALPECRKTFDRDHEVTVQVLADLAALYAIKKDIDKVRRYLVESLDMARALNGPEDSLTDFGTRTIGTLYLFTREHAAERYVRDHLDYAIRHGLDAAERGLTEGRLGLCLLYRKSHAEGETLLQESYDRVAPGRHDLSIERRGEYRNLLSQVIPFYEEAGDKDRAALWKVRRMDFDFPAQPIQPPPTK